MCKNSDLEPIPEKCTRFSDKNMRLTNDLEHFDDCTWRQNAPECRKLPAYFGAVIVTTERLFLMPIGREHKNNVVKYLGNFNVAKWLAVVPHPYQSDSFDGWFDSLQTEDPDSFQFALVTRGSLEMIGNFGIHQQDDESRLPIIGYWLGEPFWGKGYMKEAGNALVAQIFNFSSVQEIASGYFEDNARSASVLTALGFKPAGSGKVHCIAQNKDLDHCDVQLTRQNYFDAQRAT